MAMRNPWADEFERSLRSPACLGGAHGDCPHLHGFGGGPNPRRLRLEFGVMLCKCECHSSCPVTSKRMAVPVQTYIESCTCPGGEDQRSGLYRAGARARRDSQARKEAFNAVKARAAGMSRDQIKDLYKAELRARGLDIPPEVLLDADVSLMIGEYLAAVRYFGQAAGGFAKMLGSIFRFPS
jgi:hypothetical protein